MKQVIPKILVLLFTLTSAVFIALIPINAFEESNELKITLDEKAGSVYVYSYDADRVLYCSNPHEKIPPASSAKIMTGLLVCEIYADKLDESIEITDGMLKGHTGTSMGLRVGMTVTVKDLLYGTVCGGNNDASIALAVACAGSVDAFVKEMNILANRLYMKNTHYENPSGLDDKDAFTTLSDTALLIHKAAANEIYMSASSAAYFDFTPKGEEMVTVNNRNALVNRFSAQGYTNKHTRGIISGNTDDGGYTLATFAEKSGASYLCLVMGAQADGEHIYSYYTVNQILDLVFDQYSYVKAISAGDVLDSCEVAFAVSDGDKARLNAVLKNDLYIFTTSDIDVKKDLKYVTYYHSDELRAPISKGSVIGGIDVYYGDILMGRAKLVAAESIQPNSILSFLDAMKSFMLGRTFIIALIVFFPLLAIYIATESRRSRHKKVETLYFNKFS